jgi:predicted lipid-binding transport protein (Tim44 family)/tellurite resistance protein
MQSRWRWIAEVARYFPALVVALGALPALARSGGGEHFDSGRSSSSDGGGGDGGALVELLVWLVFSHPAIGIPVLIIVAVAWAMHQRSQGDRSTRRALDRVEATRRTSVSASSVERWVSALKARDPQFELVPFLDRTRGLFLETQEAWFKRDLEPVRRFLSDATFQRLAVQLRILDAQGVRDAIALPHVVDLQIIGLEQTEFFDTVHVRVHAQAHDADAPADATDEQARALAMKQPPEPFVEVWSFVRKPGVTTKVGVAPSRGACPNCGAPFEGGASNRCTHCSAIVNSGTYDWVLAEITQGSEYAASHEVAEGLAGLRQTDPGLSTEMLEDRASLAFWKWVEAQVTGDASRLAKLATPEFRGALEAELSSLNCSGKRKVFLECAVGAVDTRRLSSDADVELASVELRWSARLGVVKEGAKPGALPSQPQRWVLVLQRRAGAASATDNGMATNRCPQCHAPLSDNGETSCEYCGAALASGAQDWVVRDFGGWEWWRTTLGASSGASPRPVAARVPDREERERLVYLMAAMAMADGEVSPKERGLLKLAADRWGVPWANVELALNAGPALFGRLLARGSAEAEAFLHQLIEVALVDGKIDAKERRMLEAAAGRLGLEARLPELLRR